MRPIKFFVALCIVCIVSSFIEAQAQPSESVNKGTYDKLMIFNQQTADIIEQFRQINRKMEPQFKRVTKTLEQTQDARAALKSGGVADMQPDLNRLLALSQQYLNHYRRFINDVDKTSSCYQPDKLQDFEGILRDTRKVAAIVPQLVNEQGNREAFDALSGLMMLQTNANILVNYFETFKMCYIADGAGSLATSFELLSTTLGENVKQVEQDLSKTLWIEQFTVDEGFDEISDEDLNEHHKVTRNPNDSKSKFHAKKIQFHADEVPDLGELFEFGVDDPEQLHALSLPDGLRFNEINRLVLTPKFEKHLYLPINGKITGVLRSYGKPVTVDIHIQRIPAKKLSDYKWSDSEIEQCVKSKQMQYVHQMTRLDCVFPPGTVISLSDLTLFSNLREIELIGGEYVSLNALNTLNRLKFLSISNAVIDDFSDFSSQLKSLNLLSVYSDNWPSLSATKVEEVFILQPENCKPIELMIESRKVVLFYPDMGGDEIIEAEAANGKPIVHTDCKW